MDRCKMCYEDEERMRCNMDGKIVDAEKYDRYCRRKDIENCPVYQYYFEEYKRLTGRS